MKPARLVLGSSGLGLLATGAVFNFAPAEAAAYLGIGPGALLPLQLWAGALLGAGALNWMSRGNSVGGIYGRPICVGNLLHFTVGAFVLARLGTAAAAPLWIACGIYAAFALCFAWLLFFGHPAAEPSPK